MKKQHSEYYFDYEGNVLKLEAKQKPNIVKRNLEGTATHEVQKGEKDSIRKTTYKGPTSLETKPVVK